MNDAPLIFNLFPRYFYTVDAWTGVLDHVSDMGFNHVFVNPFHETGFSGSLYAVKDYYRLNPYFLREDQDPADWSPLNVFIDGCTRREMRVMMDLVINHTASDSVLVASHPEWYMHDEKGGIVHPFAVDPDDASKVTVWGDLARLDHEHSSDRKGMWEYFDRLIQFFQERNIRAFRCDAAYQVPADLWSFLIDRAKNRFGDTQFYAETLGCTPEQVDALKDTGFDYLFNSSKWWSFDAPWCLEQHAAYGRIAPSISFPESHDTLRLAEEGAGTLEHQKNRYLLAAVFSRGLLMLMGYEYGARIKTDVVKGSPQDVREPRSWDMTSWIAGVNRLKLSRPVLSEEGEWRNRWPYDDDVFYMEKSSSAGPDSVLLCVNKRADQELRIADMTRMPGEVKKYTRIVLPGGDPEETIPFDGSLTFGPDGILLLVR